MRVIDFPKAQTGADMIAETLKAVNEVKFDKLVVVGITGENEYNLIAGNVTAPEILWILERGKQIVLDQEQQ